MLKHLSIKNVAVIENINIEFFEGLSVLTGETGAGKSIIIDSINLLKGERASKSIIRSGEEKARVSGVFEVSDLVAEEIAEILGCDGENEIIISREITSDGKNTIRVNGMPVNLAMLKNVGELLINIHGQHDNTSLLSVKTHLDFLDRFGEKEILPALTAYRQAYRECKETEAQIEEIDTNEQEKQRRMDILKYQISEIEEAALEPGEDEILINKKKIMDNSAKISENTAKAYDALYGGENGTAYDLLWSAIGCLEKVSSYDNEISELYDALSDIAESLTEKTRDLRYISENLSFDAEEADRIEERLELIGTLKRKYGSTTEEILEFYENAVQELEKIEMGSKLLEKLNSKLEKSKEIRKNLAAELSILRKKYGEILAVKVMEELKDLNMSKVEFKVMIDEADEYRQNGKDNAEFMIRTNVGEEIKPLAKIASGGELSRIMLAIKGVLQDTDRVKTLVFDEIDTGVSGGAAQKIGEKLCTMSKGKSVLCITHLPQIASLADNHYLIEKEVENDRTSTKVTLLEFNERIEEIARTLGGTQITDITRENAKQLLLQKKI